MGGGGLYAWDIMHFSIVCSFRKFRWNGERWRERQQQKWVYFTFEFSDWIYISISCIYYYILCHFIFYIEYRFSVFGINLNNIQFQKIFSHWIIVQHVWKTKKEKNEEEDNRKELHPFYKYDKILRFNFLQQRQCFVLIQCI